jgi:hypothetical protein
VLLRIHAFIEQHLGDADLTPGLVAAAHYISVRYLYRLFEAQGTTVATWIRHRRLEGCRKDLADPAFSARRWVPSRRGGACRIRPTSAGCSGAPTGCRRPSTGAPA